MLMAFANFRLRVEPQALGRCIATVLAAGSDVLPRAVGRRLGERGVAKEDGQKKTIGGEERLKIEMTSGPVLSMGVPI